MLVLAPRDNAVDAPTSAEKAPINKDMQSQIFERGNINMSRACFGMETS